MKNILYYFYLLCLAILLATGTYSLFTGGDEYISLIWLQLLWTPISILHCLYKFITTRDHKGIIKKLITISFGLTIVYFVLLFVIVTLEPFVNNVNEDTFGLIGIGVIPWTMLAFFTYILHKEKSLKATHTQLEDNLIQE